MGKLGGTQQLKVNTRDLNRNAKYTECADELQAFFACMTVRCSTVDAHIRLPR